MKLCRVKGTAVATVKHPALVGTTLLVVQPLDQQLQSSGSSFLAVDRVQAGEGDLVLVNSEGGGARQLMGLDQGPIRSLVVGIVDAVDIDASAGADRCGDATRGGGEA